MKKSKITRVVSLLIIFSLIFVGCGNINTEEKTVDSKKEPMNLTFLGASSTGPGAIVMNGLAECINKSYPDSVVTVVPGNLGTNVTRINNGEADGGFSNSSLVAAARAGEYPYNEEMDNLASVINTFTGSNHLVFNSELGIDSLEEIIANKMKLRISIGMPGGSSDIFFQRILSLYGLTVDDYNSWGGELLNQNIETGIQMLADKRIDGIILSSFVPTPSIEELSKNKGVVLLKLDNEIINAMCEEYGYLQSVFSAGAYSFLEEDIPNLSTYTTFIVPMDSSEENVYKITRAFYENLDYLRSTHSSMAEVDPGDFVKQSQLDLHPGAEKYYREAGLLK